MGVVYFLIVFQMVPVARIIIDISFVLHYIIIVIIIIMLLRQEGTSVERCINWH
jgi:hypothetical protein